jgi:alkylated DNA repair protein (DNA oxidative demethylase)
MELPPPPGLELRRSYLDEPAQARLLGLVRTVLDEAPLFRPRMPRTGKPLSVLMSNCGPLGWVSDETGYRYQPMHPETGKTWPAIPEMVLKAWVELGGYGYPPQACLINYYTPSARMGLHQDKDEVDFAAPVVSLSVGDSALFRVGGKSRKDPTRSFRLDSGDAVVLGGPSRLAFHGIDRVLSGSSALLPEGGRFNLTLRRVTAPDV